jgi:hypothetical protein
VTFLAFFQKQGSGIAWVNSTLVLQTMADKQMLGRVLAVEYTMTRLFEAASAAMTGRLGEAGLNKNMLALFGAVLGMFTLVFWGTYYIMAKGAAHPRFNNNYQFDAVDKVKEGFDEGHGQEIELGTVGPATSGTAPAIITRTAEKQARGSLV